MDRLINMKKISERKLKDIYIYLFLIAILVVSPKVDMVVSKYFYLADEKIFYLKDFPLFTFMRYYMPGILLGLATLILFLWIFGEIRGKKWFFGIDDKICAFTVGSIILGPGIIVNIIFKTFWGRARPLEILEFGGSKLFTPAYIMSDQCNLDCSFMSGHTSVGFWVMSFALLAPQKYRKISVLFAILFGITVGISRIAQGKHFLSDVIFAGVVTIAITTWMHKKIFKNEN